MVLCYGVQSSGVLAVVLVGLRLHYRLGLRKSVVAWLYEDAKWIMCPLIYISAVTGIRYQDK